MPFHTAILPVQAAIGSPPMLQPCTVVVQIPDSVSVDPAVLAKSVKKALLAAHVYVEDTT